MPYCPACGKLHEAGVNFCPNCGNLLNGPRGSTATGQAHASKGEAPAPTWSVSPAAWAPGERVVAGSTAFVFIALLVPWRAEGPFTIDGSHAWGWFSFIGFLAALGLLCACLVRGFSSPLSSPSRCPTKSSKPTTHEVLPLG